MNPLNGGARILLIADDRESGERYREALAAGGYEVLQAESFIEALDTPMPDPDVIAVRVRPGRLGLPAGVGQHLPDGVREQLSPGPGPGAAEEVERKGDGLNPHASSSYGQGGV